ncbi:MAG TPA: hypothetical protein ENL09_04825, partial [Bacteroidetes bacterium]|nr:hypothetical protein [Bacteroidota bacterium]
MINIYRKIRKQLAAEDKVGKYLKYAIGEIVLVVIGILIALQINNWNSQRKDRIREQLFIEQLSADLQTTVNEVKGIIVFFQDRAMASGRVIHAFYKPESQNETIINDIFIPLSNGPYMPVMGSARALVSSGNIDMIKSSEVRSAIISYIETIEAIVSDVGRYEESYYRKSIIDIYDQISLSSFRADDYKIRGLKPYLQTEFSTAVNPIPEEFDHFPFPVTLDEFFKNERVFRAYEFLLLSHRNTSYDYQDMLNYTVKLLDLLQSEGYVFNQIQHVKDNKELVFDMADLKIIQAANLLLSDSSKWNNEDDRRCQTDIAKEKYSLSCALLKASIDVTGEYVHRRSAIQLVRNETKEIGSNRDVFTHQLKEWNNHP